MFIKITKYFFTNIPNILSITVDITAIYLLYLTLICQRVEVIKVINHGSLLYGKGISLYLENRSLRNIHIKKIDIVIDNNWIGSIYKDKLNKTPLTLSAFEVKSIRTESYTSLSIPSSENFNNIKNDITNNYMNSRYHFIIETTNKTNISYYNKNKKYKAIKKFNSSNNYNNKIRTYRQVFEGEVLQPDFKYYCMLFNKTTNETIGKYIINESGFIIKGDNINGITTFTKDQMKYIEDTFKGIINDNNIDIKIIDLQEKLKFL